MYYPCRSKSYCFQANVEAEYEHYYPLSSLINRTCIILIVVLFLLPFFILIIRSLSVIFCVLIPTMCCAFSEQLLLIVVSESATDMVGDIFCSGALSYTNVQRIVSFAKAPQSKKAHWLYCWDSTFTQSDIFCSGALSWAEIVMVTATGDLIYTIVQHIVSFAKAPQPKNAHWSYCFTQSAFAM